jgi:histidine triad (HIT) family protein
MTIAHPSATDASVGGGPDRGCTFCAIVRRTSAAEIVAENPASVAFMDAEPAAFGHVLVVPKRHATDIWSLDPADGHACGN